MEQETISLNSPYELFVKLHKESTITLAILNVITLGVYGVHYVKKQTGKIEEETNLTVFRSGATLQILMLTAYFGLVLTILSWVLSTSSPALNQISFFMSTVKYILVVIWGFQMRNIFRTYLDIDGSHPHNLHWLGVIIAPVLYFNFRANRIRNEKF